MWTEDKLYCDHCSQEIKIGDKYYTMFIHGCDSVHEKCFVEWSITEHGASLGIMTEYEDEEDPELDELLEILKKNKLED